MASFGLLKTCVGDEFSNLLKRTGRKTAGLVQHWCACLCTIYWDFKRFWFIEFWIKFGFLRYFVFFENFEFCDLLLLKILIFIDYQLFLILWFKFLSFWNFIKNFSAFFLILNLTGLLFRNRIFTILCLELIFYDLLFRNWAIATFCFWNIQYFLVL